MVRLQSLVTAKWLHNAIQNPVKFKHLRILDSTFVRSDAKEDYLKAHIPGALYFDVEECRDKSSKYPYMLPSPTEFENYVGNLGISNKTHVIVYGTGDLYGFFSARRAWWMFRVFGHDIISVLNGGLTAWCDDKFETTDKIPKVSKETFKANFRPELVKSFEDMIQNQSKKEFQVIDSRPAGWFDGKEPGFTKGLSPGHILGSVSIPYSEVVDENTKRGKTPDELKALFKSAGIDLEKPLVSTCELGITACSLAFAASLCGKDDVAVYDGSWSEFYPRSNPDQRVCPDDKK